MLHPVSSDALPSPFAELIACGVLASAAEPLDPMERAFHDLAGNAGREARAGLTMIRAWRLRPDLLAVTQAWTAPDGVGRAATKGAVEAIAELCRLDETARARLRGEADRMAAQGMRVLGVAKAAFAPGAIPPAISPLRSSGWSASPIQFATMCLAPCAIAVPPGSVS